MNMTNEELRDLADQFLNPDAGRDRGRLHVRPGVLVATDGRCLLHVEDPAIALSAPPRNCDVGTADEQARRFQLFCQNHRGFDTGCSTRCPFVNTADINHCQSGWAQMPYEEGGAE